MKSTIVHGFVMLLSLFFLESIGLAQEQIYFDLPEDDSSKTAYQIEFDRWKSTENFQVQFDKLPTEGQLDRVPWSDSNWPEYRGGITWRWYNPENIANNAWEYFYKKNQPGEFFEWDFGNGRPALTRESLESMSKAEIAHLSPAEKFDVLRGEYSGYESLTEHNIDYFDSSSLTDPWSGFCSGWSAAALHFEQPGAVEITSKDGFLIPFGSSDIKALMAYYFEGSGFMQAEADVVNIRDEVDFSDINVIMKKITVMTGEDCKLEDETCGKDLTPGQFHILLGNLIGIKKQGFIIDVNPKPNQYFQPAWKYQAKVHSVVNSKNLRHVTVSVTTSVDLLEKNITGFNSSDENHFSFTLPSFEKRDENSFRTQTRTYEYIIELDEQGNIAANGTQQKWMSEDRPDSALMWQKPHHFGGPFTQLQKLYEASIKE